jgi:hypothetical protein
MKKRGRPRKWFTWALELKVHRSWVEAGFDIKNAEKAHDLFSGMLANAFGDEFRARVVSKPPRTEIRKAQGYSRSMSAMERRGFYAFIPK